METGTITAVIAQSAVHAGHRIDHLVRTKRTYASRSAMNPGYEHDTVEERA